MLKFEKGKSDTPRGRRPRARKVPPRKTVSRLFKKAPNKPTKESTRRGPGRPTDYTVELGERICELVSECVGLHKIAAMDGMPGRTTMYRWLQHHQEFRNTYVCAREAAADMMVDDIIGIADQATPENVYVAKLRIEARKWAAARFNRAYDPRVAIEHSGSLDFSDMTDEEINARISELLEKARTAGA